MSLSFLHEGDFPELYDYFIIPDVVNITFSNFPFHSGLGEIIHPNLFWEVDHLTSSEQWNIHEYDFNLIFFTIMTTSYTLTEGSC